MLVDAWRAVMLPNVQRRWILDACDLLALVVVLSCFWWLGQ